MNDENIFEIMKEIGIMLYDTWGNSLEDLYYEKKRRGEKYNKKKGGT